MNMLEGLGRQEEFLVPNAVQSRRGLCEQIRVWRKRHDMTQAELAKRTGTSVSFISMIERAERSPSHQTIIGIAKALDIPVTELFRTERTEPLDDGYFRKLVDFAHEACLSRKQVEQLVAIGRVAFNQPENHSETNNSSLSDEPCSIDPTYKRRQKR